MREVERYATEAQSEGRGTLSQSTSALTCFATLINIPKMPYTERYEKN
jgi:hypothetical protein